LLNQSNKSGFNQETQLFRKFHLITSSPASVEYLLYTQMTHKIGAERITNFNFFIFKCKTKYQVGPNNK